MVILQFTGNPVEKQGTENIPPFELLPAVHGDPMEHKRWGSQLAAPPGLTFRNHRMLPDISSSCIP